jgi:hypothetical protein
MTMAEHRKLMILSEGAVSIPEAARLLGLSRQQVHALITASVLQAFNVGRKPERRYWRIPLGSIETFLSERSNRREPTEAVG